MIVLISPVSAQCCSDDPTDMVPYSEEILTIDAHTIWNGERFVNGSLLVEGNLELIDSDLILSGEGIIVLEGGSIMIKNSSIGPYLKEAGFYIESYGDVTVEDSLLTGCLDLSNGYFGIYAKMGNLSLEGVELTRSGMIQSTVDDVRIKDSLIPGIIASSGNVTIYNSTVDGLGTSIAGNGKLEVARTKITSNLTFSNSIAAISCESGTLSIEDVQINGTYGGGLYALGATVHIESILMDLPNSQYGLKFIESIGDVVDGASILGSDTGIDAYQCPGNLRVENTLIRDSIQGFVTSGPGMAILSNVTIENTIYGVVSSSQISIMDSNIINVLTGIILDDGGRLHEMDFTISNFSQWGIQVETWNPAEFPDVDFSPGATAISSICMVGRIPLIAKGPSGEIIEGAEIGINSTLGKITGLTTGTLSLIWGYLEPTGTVRIIEYEVTGSWGNAVENITILPVDDTTFELILPMTDIYIIDLDRDDDTAIITITTNGSMAEDVVITLYLDGTYRYSQSVSLEAEERIIVEIPIGSMEEGKHQLKATARSNDEYSGQNGIFLDNNEKVITVTKKDEAGDNWLRIMGIILIVVAVVFLFATLMLRRRD